MSFAIKELVHRKSRALTHILSFYLMIIMQHYILEGRESQIERGVERGATDGEEI
jgi:hypothetical protein